MKKENIPAETKERWRKDPKNWKLWVFYYNKEDPRLMPPKRLLYTGWTVNFANPFSVLLLIAVVLLILGALAVMASVKH